MDGSGDIVRIEGSPDFVTTDGLTVAAWIKPTTDQLGYRCPVSKQYGTGMLNSWALCVHDGVAAFITGLDLLRGPTLVPDVWYHVAIRWDGMTKSLLIDGAEVKEAAGTLVFDNAGLSIGADVDNGMAAVAFSGAVDEVRIYNRAVPTDEIGRLLQ